MPASNETPGTPAPQAGNGEPPQEGTAAAGQAPAAANGQDPGAGDGQGGETAEERATRLERELRETRAEAAKYRREAGDLKTAQQRASEQGLSEVEREAKRAAAAEARAQELEGQLREQALRTAAVAAATKLNYRNPELAYRLLDSSAVEWSDETGQPRNVESLLRELAKSETYLVRAGGSDYGGGNRGPTPSTEPSMNELMRAALGKG